MTTQAQDKAKTAVADIKQLITALEMKVHYAEEAVEEEADWGDVGDLYRIKALLKQALGEED